MSKSRKAIVLIGLLVAVDILFVFLPIRAWFTQIESYVQELGKIGPVVVALGYALTTVLLIPRSATRSEPGGSSDLRPDFWL